MSVVVGFYSEDEIIVAKNLLFSVTDDMLLKPEGLPRQIKRQPSDNKKKLDCDDILKLYKALDLAKVNLPQFMAGNLSRLPSVKPGEVDIYVMAVTIANLTQQLQKVTERLVALEAPPKQSYRKDPTPVETVIQSEVTSGATGERDSGRTDDSWSGIAASNADEWKHVEAKRKARAPAPIRVKGRSTDNQDKLKSVPRKPILAAYVGRLHPDTTAEDLSKFLEDEGIKGVVCRKLLSKNGTVYKTAAFYVTCCIDSRDLFYNENCWPEGVELRDWIYYNRQ